MWRCPRWGYYQPAHKSRVARQLMAQPRETRGSEAASNIEAKGTIAGPREMPLDDRLKQLMKQLGDAINESLSESEQIGEAIAKIKEHGYDVFLVLEATIGFSKRDAEDEEESTQEPVTASA